MTTRFLFPRLSRSNTSSVHSPTHQDHNMSHKKLNVILRCSQAVGLGRWTPAWSLQTVSGIPQKLGFGSCHDVFCHVVAGHAHCHCILSQSISACHVDPLPVMSCPAMTRRIIGCPAAPWPKTHVISYCSVYTKNAPRLWINAARPCKTLGCACLRKRDEVRKSRTSRCTEREPHTRRPIHAHQN